MIPAREPPNGAYVRSEGSRTSMNYEVVLEGNTWVIYTEDYGYRQLVARRGGWEAVREFFGLFLTNIEYLEF